MSKGLATRESEEDTRIKEGWVIVLLKVNDFNHYLLSIKVRVSRSHSPMSERK